MIKRNFSVDKPLFICDLANNHFGDISHAEQIIDELSSVANEVQEALAIKFQFRNLDNYIHPNYVQRRDLKYIDRFLSTRLDFDDFARLTKRINSKKLITMATPFDEDGVEWCKDLGIEIIKIASASANDYPLIEKISEAEKPVVASTAGLKIEEIDDLVFRLYDKVPSLIIMHCVAIYPCDDASLNLNQIKALKKRYSGIEIGFSTHERPNSLTPITVATSLGSVAFERHVGIRSKKYDLNDYSSEPNQIKAWINSSKKAREVLGPANRPPSPVKERETLNDLKRGIFARRNILEGERIDSSNSFLAFPLLWREGQFHSGNLQDNLVATENITVNQSITHANAVHDKENLKSIVNSVVLQLRGLLAGAKVEINPEASIELSHHYGLERFREFGAVLITCYNDEYAKKLVVQLPRQKHPYHFHSNKQETFQLLWGDMELTVNGRDFILKPGELYTVKRGEWHKFHTLHGAVVEEISTRAIPGDSFYEDSAISKLALHERKTSVENWLNKS